MIEKQFEYKQLFKTYPGINTTELNEYGKERWELCGNKLLVISDSVYRYIFKREIIKDIIFDNPIGFITRQRCKVIILGKKLTYPEKDCNSTEYCTIITDAEFNFKTFDEKESLYKKFSYARNFLMLFSNSKGMWYDFISEYEATSLYIHNHENWNFEQSITTEDYDFKCKDVREFLERFIDNALITEVISIELRFYN